MVYINIPFVSENKKIERDIVQKELEALDISEDAKYEAFQSIYNLHPRGVSFDDKDLNAALQLESVLARLGIPYRQTETPEFQ